MRSIPAQLQRIACGVLVPALLVWFVAGAGCLGCCTEDVKATGRQDKASIFSAEVVDALETASCPAGEDHCRKANGKVSSPVYNNCCDADKHLNGRMSCCAPSGRAADLVRKPGTVPERTDSTAVNDEQRGLQLVTRMGSYSFPAGVYDRSRIYLRDCVFLI
jgi:hypothetical protein